MKKIWHVWFTPLVSHNFMYPGWFCQCFVIPRPGSLSKKIGPLKGTLNKIEQARCAGDGAPWGYTRIYLSLTPRKIDIEISIHFRTFVKSILETPVLAVHVSLVGNPWRSQAKQLFKNPYKLYTGYIQNKRKQVMVYYTKTMEKLRVFVFNIGRTARYYMSWHSCHEAGLLHQQHDLWVCLEGGYTPRFKWRFHGENVLINHPKTEIWKDILNIQHEKWKH